MGKPGSRAAAALILLAIFGSGYAQASDDSVDQRQLPSFEPRFELISPELAFARTQAVLDHFGVSAEPDSQPRLDGFENLQTLEGFKNLLPYFDADNEILKFVDASVERLDAYQDPDARKVPDFSVEFKASSDSIPENPLTDHLRAARAAPADQSLRGLRIALDPGHMGGSWDEVTGKWVANAQGKKLSEGVINLQTAMLLEQQLTALGAEVMITHRGLRPVTDQDYATFDVRAAGLDALREASLLDWFKQLLEEGSGQALYSAFSNSSDFKDLFAERNRETYFNSVDLQARVDAIDAFQPDLTLIIHYDAATHAVSTDAPFKHDATKVYVPGAFMYSELASRADRVELTRSLLDEVPWRASVALAHQIVTTLSANLKIPFDPESPGNIKRIEPGMFARNLYLLKKHRSSATAYVECLYYNDRGEFEAISKATHPMQIDGVNMPYSDRLVQVASSLRQAVVQFVKTGF